MFRATNRHLQSAFITNIDHLSPKQQQRLDESWAGVF